MIKEREEERKKYEMLTKQLEEEKLAKEVKTIKM